jgi:hypothetical protein
MSDKINGHMTEPHQHIKGSITSTDKHLLGQLSSNGPKDYNKIYNKPKIEGVTLEGDKSFEDLNLMPLTNAELAAILD